MTPRIKARLKHYRMLGRLKDKIRPDTSKGKVGSRVERKHPHRRVGFYQYGLLWG